MDNFNFIKTDDGSVGLYSDIANDILHSKTGALKEANEKFINPAKHILKKNKNLKILDICSGVGYNLKGALLNLQYKEATIDCLDINKTYILLSPIIQDGINDLDMKIFILSEILRCGFSLDEIYSLILKIEEKGLVEFLYPNMSNFIKYIKKEVYKTFPDVIQSTFLHNIYYKYISNSMKDCLETNKYERISINFKVGDARESLKISNFFYDIVFLDGFTPQKDPTLWTIDFLRLIKTKMNKNSILTSYSKSTPFRSALLNLNFHVGKTFLDNIDMGTVASINPCNINSPLNEYDIKLFQTRSGIPYKDSNLNLFSSQILLNREIEQKKSNKQSHTSFLKEQRNIL